MTASKRANSDAEGTRRSISLILHKETSSNQQLQEAMGYVWSQGHTVQELLSYGPDDPVRLAAEAAEKGFDAVVAVGGDGTLNQVINGVFQSKNAKLLGVGIVPFGTANDFATECHIPENPVDALQIIAKVQAVPLDVGKVTDRVFINIASCGFPAEITAEAPSKMKQIFSKFAYFLTGLAKATSVSAKQGRLTGPDFEWQGKFLALSVCNGRQAGGGF